MSVTRQQQGQLISSNLIQFDASTNGGSATATSLTFSHTVSAAANAVLFVAVKGSTSDVITGVTYGGVSLVQVGKALATSSGYVYLYFLNAPASGANNVIISASGSITILGAAASYVNAIQGVIDASGTNTFNSFSSLSDFGATVTVVAQNSWMVYVTGNTGGTPSAGSSTTQLQVASGFGFWHSNGPKNTGANSLYARVAGTQNWAGVGASFASISSYIGTRTNAGTRTASGARALVTY